MITKIIEYFIPPEYHVTEELLRRARLAVSVYMLVGLFSLSYSVLNLIIGFWGGLLSQAPLFLTSLLCLFLYRGRVAPFTVASIFFTVAIMAISTAIYFSGGFSSFILPWLATTPIVALLVSGKKMGYYTLFAQLAMLIMFYIFELSGISATGKYTTDIPLSFILSCYIGLIVLFYAVATVFENGKSYAMNMLFGKNEELQHVIHKLKSTQQKLVQREKLASLGQLTAGIAHEIKNPLNFVNNFSEVSIELIEEARQELSAISSQSPENRNQKSPSAEGTPLEEGGAPPAGGVEDINQRAKNPDIEYTLSILNDIETNLQKIHEHGSRADSIVKYHAAAQPRRQRHYRPCESKCTGQGICKPGLSRNAGRQRSN
jgi:signal transduction histidine kinase